MERQQIVANLFWGGIYMTSLSNDLVVKCKTKLLSAKTEILNRVRESRTDLYNSEDAKGGEIGRAHV